MAIWKKEYESGWDRTKEALRRDWEQTKHDFGSKTAPELNQDVSNTVKQAAGKESIPDRMTPNFDEHIDAFKYGYGARQHYAGRAWDANLESEIARDYSGNFVNDRDYIRRSYLFQG